MSELDLLTDCLKDTAKERDELADALEQCQVESEARREDAISYRKALSKLLAADGDHMTACDRTMGDSHPCTCGANDACQLFTGDKQ